MALVVATRPRRSTWRVRPLRVLLVSLTTLLVSSAGADGAATPLDPPLLRLLFTVW